MTTLYFTQDKETGTIIDSYPTFRAAMRAIKCYEKEDKKNNCFEQDFYEIRMIVQDKFGVDEVKYFDKDGFENKMKIKFNNFPEQKKYFVHDKKNDEPFYSSATLEDCYRVIGEDHDLYQVKMLYNDIITVYDEKGNEVKKYRV